MRKSNWTPSIVPNGNHQTVYLVADDFGKYGRAWRETDCDTADFETVIQDLLMRDIPLPLQNFTDRYEGRYRGVQLPLPIRLA